MPRSPRPCGRCRRSSMRPASRRALLKRLAAVAPTRSARIWSAAALVVVAAVLSTVFFDNGREPIRVAPATQRSAPVLDPVLALPFGEGNAAAVAAATTAPATA